MKKLTIPFSGITRNTDDAVCKDGECMELINARVRNGSLQPIGRPTIKKNIPLPLRKVYYHSNGGYSNFLGVTPKMELYWVGENNILIHTFTKEVVDILSIGNTLIVSVDDNKYYFLYKNNRYVLLGDEIPFPEINFRIKATGVDPIIKTDNYADITISGGQDTKAGFNGFDEQRTKEFTNSVHGTVLKVLNEAKDMNAFFDPLFVRYAIRLYDNSYVLHSAPLYLSLPIIGLLINNQTGDWQDFTHLTGIRYDVRVNIMGLYYSFLSVPTYGDWGDIVQSIDVFVSRSIPTFDFNEDIQGYSFRSENKEVSFSLNMNGVAKVQEAMNANSQFFLFHSFDIQDLQREGWINKPQNSFDNIELKERLVDDEFSHTKTGGKMFKYNSRLHLFNIKTQLFNGYNIYEWIELESGSRLTTSPITVISGEVWVYLNTDDGLKIVRKAFGNLGVIYGLQPFLSYPDARAYRMVIYMAANTGAPAMPYYVVSVTLKPHDYLNLAFYNHGYPFSKNDSLFKGLNKIPVYTGAIPMEYTPNKLKVSQVNNPFYFPNKNTYQPCTSKITALASNTQAVSSGQFGHYPLYVFSEGGIYAMQIGSGDVLYSNTTPVSRDVLLSRDAVCGTGSALVFLSKQGLMILSGSETQVISESMNGFVSRNLQNDPTIRKVLELANLDNAISTLDFFDYIKDSKLGYSYGDNEVIISNQTQEYSYVVSLDTLLWHKVSRKFSQFPNSYPESIGIETVGDSIVAWDLLNKNRSASNVAVITRPIKLGSLTHKRILQAAMRGVIYKSNDLLGINSKFIEFFTNRLALYPECAFYVMASNDAANFKVVSGREKFTDIRDLVLKMNKLPAFKYYIFMVIGGVLSEVVINHIELLADEAFGNRLR